MRKLSDNYRTGEELGLSLSIEKKEEFLLKTSVELFLVDKDGNTLEHLELGENVITDQGRANMAHLLAGDDAANRIVTTMKFGDGGHNPSDPTQPLPTDPTDDDLYGTVIITKNTDFEFPDGAEANKVTFTAEVASNEGNGGGSQAYSEVGMYDVTGRLMMHKTFGLITKSEAFGLVFRYSIIF